MPGEKRRQSLCGGLLPRKPSRYQPHRLYCLQKAGESRQRNRIRRRLREIVRLNQQKLEQGYDLILVAAPRAVDADYQQLEADLLSCCGQASSAERKKGTSMKQLLLAMIRFYRKYISPMRAPCCRFIPTCSQYALEAIEKYGALKGGWLALKRICRCHPFYHGKHPYYDPVP